MRPKLCSVCVAKFTKLYLIMQYSSTFWQIKIIIQSLGLVVHSTWYSYSNLKLIMLHFL